MEKVSQLCSVKKFPSRGWQRKKNRTLLTFSQNGLFFPSAMTTETKLCRVNVVYFDQRLGAAQSKRWSNKSFLAFFVQKT